MIYFAQAEGSPLVKIGTSERVSARLKQIAKELNRPVSLLAVCAGGRAEESMLHDRFAELRQHGEWFWPNDDLMVHITSVGIDSDQLGPKKKQTTVGVDPELQERLEAEARRVGIGWTTLIVMLAREALAKREASQ